MSRVIVVVSLLFAPSIAWGGGLCPPGGNHGARNLSRGGASIAVPGGLASYSNVANLHCHEWRQLIEVGFDTIFTGAQYQPIGGQTEEAELGIFPLPMLSLTNRLDDTKTIGVEFYPSDGLGITYDHGPYRKSLLASANLTVGFAWQMTDTVTVGIGGDLVYGQLVYHSIFDQWGFPVEPLFMKSELSGWGTGFRLGLRWEPCDWFSLGLSYSSPRKVEMEGNTDVSLFGCNLGRLHPKTEVTFPGRAGIGIAIKPAPQWLLALDLEEFDYSDLDQIRFDFGGFSISQKMGWDNDACLRIGLEKQVNANWTWRTGCAFLWPAIPPDKQNRIIPEGWGWGLTGGLGWRNDRGDMEINVAVLIGGAHREVEPAFGRWNAGKYDEQIGMLSFSLTRYF